MMDMVTRSSRFPKSGETLIGSSFDVFPGGKGVNQAVTLGRMGNDVTFLGKVGKDHYGEVARKTLEKSNVNVKHLLDSENYPTGTGTVMLNDEGENRIVIVPGANLDYSIEDFDRVMSEIDNVDLFMLQLEMDFEMTEYVIQYAFNHSIPLLLNPAPGRMLSDELLSKITYLTPNETELEILLNEKIQTGGKNVETLIQRLKAKGVKNIITTLGSQGAIWMDENNKITRKNSFKVDVVDTVAAGDSFNGAFVHAISKGMSNLEVLEFANACGALTVTKNGATKSIPNLSEVEDFIKNSK